METSQNAGRPVIAGDPSGGWNVPPVKDFAEIEVTSANFSAVKLSHVPADADDTAATAPNKTAEHGSTFNRLIMIFPPCHSLSTALAPFGCICTRIIGQSRRAWNIC
jgi:hypothetical protein